MRAGLDIGTAVLSCCGVSCFVSGFSKLGPAVTSGEWFLMSLCFLVFSIYFLVKYRDK